MVFGVDIQFLVIPFGTLFGHKPYRALRSGRAHTRPQHHRLVNIADYYTHRISGCPDIGQPEELGISVGGQAKPGAHSHAVPAAKILYRANARAIGGLEERAELSIPVGNRRV